MSPVFCGLSLLVFFAQALEGLQLQVAKVCLGSEGSGGLAEQSREHFETVWEWARGTQTETQGNAQFFFSDFFFFT